MLNVNDKMRVNRVYDIKEMSEFKNNWIDFLTMLQKELKGDKKLVGILFEQEDLDSLIKYMKNGKK